MYRDKFLRPGKAYCRQWLRCPVHRGCRKYRNLGEGQTSVLGPHEPLAYLIAWLRAAELPDLAASAAAHKRHRPSERAVAAVHAEYWPA